MRSECISERFDFASLERREVVADFAGGEMTSDAGALLLGAGERAIGLIDRFAACFRDWRCQELIEHSVRTLVGQRIFGIALGYEDLEDHDEPPRPGLCGACRQARGQARGLCAACRQEHAEPSGAERPGPEVLPEGLARSCGDREAVRRSVCGGTCAAAASGWRPRSRPSLARLKRPRLLPRARRRGVSGISCGRP